VKRAHAQLVVEEESEIEEVKGTKEREEAALERKLSLNQQRIAA
jgi:hypothetical protein